MRKKIIIVLLLIVFAYIFSLNAMADETNKVNRTYTTDDVTVVDGKITEQQLVTFVAYLNGETLPETKNLLCDLFGHKLEKTATVYVIDHKVYISQPRCVEKRYDVYSCTRCSYEEYRFINSYRIVCCN